MRCAFDVSVDIYRCAVRVHTPRDQLFTPHAINCSYLMGLLAKSWRCVALALRVIVLREAGERSGGLVTALVVSVGSM